jgi:basic membrane protein A
MKKIFNCILLILIMSLAFTSCSPASSETAEQASADAAEEVDADTTEEVEETSETAGMKFCQVTNVAGIDDKSFNQLAWEGMQKAGEDFDVEVQVLESRQQSDYEININTFIEQECDLIVSVGYLMTDATIAAAEANPDFNFATIDVDSLGIANLKGNSTKIDQATFLAGYLSAGMTETGKVGTYVGILLPSTQPFMDGYAMGIQYYNEVKGTDVELLGWDVEKQEGLEVGNFESLDDGRAFAEALMDDGADIIMPVAGPVGLGSLAVMVERDAGLLIGVDDDWAAQNPEQADYILASAIKRIDVFVYNNVEQVIDGTFTGGDDYILDLENGGTSLGYGSAWEDKIPDELKTEIESLIPKIISGEIETLPVR